jgi:hypothetical protein
VSVRLNAAELLMLDERRAGLRMQRGEYLRSAALHRLPPTIPEVNREAWSTLARTAANLNQIAHRLNAGDALPLDEVRAALDAFRRDLIGVKHSAEDAEDESEG